MAVGLPAKTTYADGDVFSASDINDTNGTINLIGQTQNFYAGKNKIINGDFSVWQRGTSFSTGNSNYVYTADRWATYFYGNNTTTVTQQTFTPGTAPVTGYESQYFCRIASTSTFTFLQQRIEDVRTFAGQTVTFSFWAKSASAQTLSEIGFTQEFGSGGSAAVNFTGTAPAITTSWARYSVTVAMPSISGKTVGTSSSLYVNIKGAINNNLDTWGWQLESGSVATAFQTATGTIQGELAACQRYFFRFTSTGYSYFTTGANRTSTRNDSTIRFPVTMRTSPAGSYSAANTFMIYQPNAGTIVTATSIGGDGATPNSFGIVTDVASGLTAGNAANLRSNNTTAFFDFNAEL
jgi:hypothetical protein